MLGKRHDLTENDDWLEPSEYGRHWRDGNWYCRAPKEGTFFGNLSKHDVIEHEDGTITVSPSILITKHDGQQWHGFLERGIWREA